jgi:hypothetical protein
MKKVKSFQLASRSLSKKKETLSKIYDRKFDLNIQTKLSVAKDVSKPSCSATLGPIIDWKYPFLDYETISNLVKDQFYNVKVMETMTCLLNGLNSEQSYMDLLKDIRIIDLGPKKKDVMVFFSNLANGKNKVITIKYDGEEILNEWTVGLIMNSLRKIIPTFTWTYGLTQCNLPMFVQTNGKINIVSACNEKVQLRQDQYIGLITEYIEGPTLADYVASSQITVKKLRSALMTILFSIRYANIALKYVHWDLHDSNILMRQLDSEDNYIYLKNDNKYLYVGDHLATIIDFGLNSVHKNNQLIANYLHAQSGINPDVSESSNNDILKLLNYLYRDLRTKRNPLAKMIFQEVRKMFSIFTGIDNVKELDEFHRLVTENYGIYPNENKEKNINKFVKYGLEQLIQYLVQVQPDLLLDKKPTQGNILSCLEEPCLSEDEIISIIFNRKDSILNLTDLKGYQEMLLNKSQRKMVNQFIQNHIDSIVYNIEKIKTRAKKERKLSTVLLVNELRLLDKDLIQLYKITSNLGLKDFVKQINKLKTQIIRLLKEYQDYGLMTLDKDRDKIKEDILVAESQKDHWMDLLENEFVNLKTKYEYRPRVSPSGFIGQESQKRKASKSPGSPKRSPKKQNI